MKSLVLDAKIFGVTLFGGVAMIKTVTMVNYIDEGVQHYFSMINVFDFLEHCSNGGKKDASYIASLFFESH